jgi:hypothetical protein
MLPCTALERFFIDDQAAGSDVMAQAVFDLERGMDKETISASFHDALARHPLLTSKIGRDPDGRPCWIPTHCNCLFFDVESFLANLDPRSGIDLEKNNGFKVLVEQFDDRTRIRIRFHHAVCDGLAAIDFFKEWMSVCRAMAEGREPERREIDASLLVERGLPRWRKPVGIGRIASAWALIRNGARWIAARPLRIRSERASNHHETATDQVSGAPLPDAHITDDTTLVDGADCHCRTFIVPSEELHVLRKSFPKEQSTLNDILISKIFFSLSDPSIRNRLSRIEDSYLFRMSIPNSLRLRGDKRISACNILGLSFIDRRINCNRVFDDLFFDVSIQMSEIRRWNGGQAFLDGLAFFQKLTPLYQKFLKSDLCFATAVYSSAGDVSSIDPDLLCLSGKPPLRRNTNIAVFTALVKGGLAVTVSMSRSGLSPADRDAILGRIQDALKP